MLKLFGVDLRSINQLKVDYRQSGNENKFRSPFS